MLKTKGLYIRCINLRLIVYIYLSFQLQTFNVEGANGSVEELTDGVAMAHALHQM